MEETRIPQDLFAFYLLTNHSYEGFVEGLGYVKPIVAQASYTYIPDYMNNDASLFYNFNLPYIDRSPEMVLKSHKDYSAIVFNELVKKVDESTVDVNLGNSMHVRVSKNDTINFKISQFEKSMVYTLEIKSDSTREYVTGPVSEMPKKFKDTNLSKYFTSHIGNGPSMRELKAEVEKAKAELIRLSSEFQSTARSYSESQRAAQEYVQQANLRAADRVYQNAKQMGGKAIEITRSSYNAKLEADEIARQTQLRAADRAYQQMIGYGKNVRDDIRIAQENQRVADEMVYQAQLRAAKMVYNKGLELKQKYEKPVGYISNALGVVDPYLTEGTKKAMVVDGTGNLFSLVGVGFALFDFNKYDYHKKEERADYIKNKYDIVTGLLPFVKGLSQKVPFLGVAVSYINFQYELHKDWQPTPEYIKDCMDTNTD